MEKSEDPLFGTYLRGNIAEASISIRKLAHQCGIDPTTISRLVAGNQKPQVSD